MERHVVSLIDARYIDQGYRLKREVSLPELVQEDPVIAPGECFGSVLRDESGLFRNWYLMLRHTKRQVEGLPDLDKVVYCEYYATSRDGIQWEKPHLQKISQHAGLQDTTPLETHAFLASGQVDVNGLELCGLSGPEGFSVIDATITPHPQARGRFTAMYLSSLGDGLTDGYKGKPTGGLCFAWSDNGVDWTAYPENPVIKGWMDTNNCFFYDTKIGKYVIYGRPNVFAKLGSNLSNRIVARSESNDLIHWSPYQTVLDTDDRDADPLDYIDEAGRQRFWDEHFQQKRKASYKNVSRGRNRQFYGIVVFPYRDIYVGFAQMYDILSGNMWLELCHSYDGVNWLREAVPVPFIAPREGHWDCGMTSSAPGSPPVQVGDDLYIYYSGSTYNHHQHGLPAVSFYGIGLRKLKRDRYIGYRAGEHEGELITAPFDCSDKLYLNYAIQEGGEIRVEVVGANNEEIPGFGLEACIPLTEGDSLAREITYANGQSLTAIAVPQIRFRIRYRHAVVYGFELEYK